MGTAPIESIDLVKNGEVIATREYLTAALRSHSWVQIGFESSSEVLRDRDNPRGYRIWEGSVTFRGARPISVRTPGFENHHIERAGIDPENPQRVDFFTETRGRSDIMLVELEGASERTVLDFHIEASAEYGAAPIRIRQFADIPEEDFSLSFGDLDGGKVARDLPVEEYIDTVFVKLTDPAGSYDQEFAFVDEETPRRGDYYYVRVRQLDGAMAWSSPWWIGGEAVHEIAR